MVTKGGIGQTTCTIHSKGSFSGPVKLACDDLPPYVSCSFDANPVTPGPGGSVVSELTLSVEMNAQAGLHPFKISGTSGALTFESDISLSIAVFADDFSDGDYTSPSWTVKGGIWSASTNAAMGTVTKKGELISPDFGGCVQCTFQADMKIQATGRLSLYAWYQGKDYVEIRLMQDKQKLFVKQRLNKLTAKTSVSLSITPDTVYSVKATYDGSTIQVFVDGALAANLSNPAGSPNGNLKFRLKSTTGASTNGTVDNVLIH